jgi:hypothetical protein
MVVPLAESGRALKSSRYGGSLSFSNPSIVVFSVAGYNGIFCPRTEKAIKRTDSVWNDFKMRRIDRPGIFSKMFIFLGYGVLHDTFLKIVRKISPGFGLFPLNLVILHSQIDIPP